MAVWYIEQHHRSQVITRAMLEGIGRHGDQADYLPESKWGSLSPELVACWDAHVFYGLEGKIPDIFGYAAHFSRAVYIDLGYWGRRAGGRYAGYHKISVNARHPTAYFRKPAHSPFRFNQHRIPVMPWAFNRPGGQHGNHILLVGMGAKGAAAEGFKPQEWERWAVAEIRKHTDRPIVYRPKPSDPLGGPIEGTRTSSKAVDVEAEFPKTWAVVTHHSNVAVDALLAGIPCFCWGGVARDLSLQDVSFIESPLHVDFHGIDRAQWAADIAWTQWSVAEMQTGQAWAHLRKDRLI